MRRADRLFQLILLLGRGRVVTAKALGEQLEVSERTIYRDIQDLMANGVPIDGQAGVGYHLRAGYQVPPMMFTPAELQALAFGAGVTRGWADKTLAKAADSALAKIHAVLPPNLRHGIDNRFMYVPDFHVPSVVPDRLGQLRECISHRQCVRLRYSDAGEARSERVIWPLGLFYWGATWSAGAWCELRQDFRNFRVDRIIEMECLAQTYPDQEGRRLTDFLRHTCAP